MNTMYMIMMFSLSTESHIYTFLCTTVVNAERAQYVINHRPIWVRNGCPSSVTDVTWYEWARDRVRRGPGSIPGEPPFFKCQFQKS